MVRRSVLLALVLALCAAPVPADVIAPGDFDTLLGTIRANREALVAVNLGLDEAEGTRFWPVYERYAKEMEAIQQRVLGVVEDYVASFRDLSDEKALALMNAYLAAEEERAKVRRAYVPSFEAVLPGRKVARFYQIENKMDAVLRYEMASRIPVVEP
jgi:ABC-type Fe3+ transport system substrate-binding protein